MKKFFTGMLVLALLASLIGCSAETSTSADASASNLIYENTISPNEKYIAQESDKVFYTIQVYQEENGVKVASSSNSAFSQAPGKFFKKFFQWLNLISFLSVGTTTKKRRFYHRISASITILVFLRGKGIRCPSSLCFRMDRTMTHTFGLCESLFLVEISGIEPLTS